MFGIGGERFVTQLDTGRSRRCCELQSRPHISGPLICCPSSSLSLQTSPWCKKMAQIGFLKPSPGTVFVHLDKPALFDSTKLNRALGANCDEKTTLYTRLTRAPGQQSP